MKHVIRWAALALLLMPAMVTAQDFEAGKAAYEAGDYATALREWRPLAEQGDAAAQALLGIMYDSGQGVPQDDAEAVKWYRLAAAQGYAKAQLNLGVRYGKGQGVPQDFIAAHMWFNISGANGDSTAAVNRDKIAAMLSPADLSTAQRSAKVCMASNYRDCD
ncbi:MAG: tetratricopeptide repeat protein [Pseudorhodobacter sp.]|nr:tetratricopeptide repeat protein [Pseudorhodobacter sp.]